MTGKSHHKWTFWSNRNVLYFYLGSGSMSVNISKNSLNCTLWLNAFYVNHTTILKSKSIQYKQSTATRIKGKNHEIRILENNSTFQDLALQGVLLIRIYYKDLVKIFQMVWNIPSELKTTTTYMTVLSSEQHSVFHTLVAMEIKTNHQFSTQHMVMFSKHQVWW